ncbi:hypothetical protein HAX54_012036 [Datura stramonium]|uniref:Uncharacterized protein n=1 Tax=Datura stramonium TaxID=4076 RepID=A0ABS8TL22_DATST|nr:hypothetical protein [Datura stramonium]
MENEKEKEVSSIRSTNTRHRRSSSVSCSLSSTSNQISHDSSLSSANETSKLKKSPHRHFPEIKERCKNIMNRFGKHRRHASADFSYDQLSYSKNFEDNDEKSFDDVEDFPQRNFTARLPSSPPSYSKVATKFRNHTGHILFSNLVARLTGIPINSSLIQIQDPSAVRLRKTGSYLRVEGRLPTAGATADSGEGWLRKSTSTKYERRFAEQNREVGTRKQSNRGSEDEECSREQNRRTVPPCAESPTSR